MECPTCHGDINIPDISVEVSAEEDGVEVGFACGNCGLAFFAVLAPGDFEQID